MLTADNCACAVLNHMEVSFFFLYSSLWSTLYSSQKFVLYCTEFILVETFRANFPDHHTALQNLFKAVFAVEMNIKTG